MNAIRRCGAGAACFVLCACAVAAGSAAAETLPDPPVTRELDIRLIADPPWCDGTEDPRRVLQSAAGTLWPYFPGRQLPPIIVQPKGGPIVLYRRGPAGEYYVRLDTGERLWAQHAFQFAHEFCHILCNYTEQQHRNKWFEESLCELASLFALRRMSETWQTQPPYPNWKSYAPALRQYAENRIQAAQLPEGTSLAEWFRAQAESLYESPHLREKNTIVAAALLPLFEAQPEHWNAVSYLNAFPPQEKQDFAAFLRRWRDAAAERHHAFIGQIAEQFGFDLSS